ncbi:UDP-N-acetylmuramate dehydrogenase [Oceanivirga salmonicida]|uniref:UDP-N-acetylmuramate dehydrogenase n=1 Tax=Oceanivirga salmonicida TaxID=1769291 RepID=UPI0012E0C8DF|nr:UDP-N-acetylmuramate dehydrogenase [Oceanivirga salmonicida]
MIIQNDISMKQYSNMKIGGIAKKLVFIEKEDELVDFFKDDEKYYLLGNGTNTLIDDNYLDMTFVCLKKLNKIENLENNKVYVQAGVNLEDFTKFMEENDLGGLENITGIPGTIGGLVNMNGGAYGTTIFDKIISVKVYSKSFGIKDINKKDLDLKYRETKIKKEKWIVIGAYFELDDGFDKEKAYDKIEKRQNNHPLDLPNLGSTFKNPDGDFAARLIMEAGLKGYRIGEIEVSTKHPNFLVNKGNAKFDDVLKLIKHVQKIVKEKFDVLLDTEIIIIKGDK